MANTWLLDHVRMTITNLQCFDHSTHDKRGYWLQLLQDDEEYTEEHDGEEHEHDQECNRQQMAISMNRSWAYLQRVATMDLAIGRQ